jgi:hypothetical protein
MIEVRVTQDIDASAATVWAVLTDLDSFAAWNPFIRRAQGSTEVGGMVHVRVRPRRGVLLPFHAKVIERTADRELRWRGHVLSPWLASGDHTFTIEPRDGGGVTFVQRETFGGALPWLAKRMLAREAKRGFDAMNGALAARAEAQERGA